MIWVTSDWHLNPGGEFTPAWEVKSEDTVVLNGDILDILPWGLKPWLAPEGNATIQSLVEALPDGAIYLNGNHEGRLSWIKELFKDYPQIEVARFLDIEIGAWKYHLEHGHRQTEWWLLRLFAGGFVDWLVSNEITRRWWYNFAAKRGWMPGTYPPNPKVEEIIGFYWANVLRQAVKTQSIWVVGHSHRRVDILPPSLPRIGVIDCGARQIVKLEEVGSY